MERIAVYAGSFCPFTKGHEDIVRQALPLFDTIIILVGKNSQKKDVFSVEDRLKWISRLYVNVPNVYPFTHDGLTVNFCKSANARYLIRGLRSAQDFESEQAMAEINHRLNPDVETVFFIASLQYRNVSSSLVRELWALKADYSPYLSYPLPPYQP